MRIINKLFVVAMSSCMTISLLIAPTHAEEIDTIINDGSTVTLEEVQDDIKTRGATDEYYKTADMYYKVTNAMGQLVRYQNYTNIKIPSKKVYSYT